MGRQQHSCCLKPKLRKGLWSPEEDEKLFNHITAFGVGCWSTVPKLAGLHRCGKSCRLRWINYLRPDLKRGGFSQQEEDLIIRLHEILGNRWSQMAAQLPGRTDNEIKNFWNSCLKKKLRQRGIDPSTHKPLGETEEAKPDQNHLIRGGPMRHLPMNSVFDSFASFEFHPGLDRTGADFSLYDQIQQNFGASHQNELEPGSRFCDYGDVADASETCAYGESSSNSNNWNCNMGVDMSNVLGIEAENWESETKLESASQAQIDEMQTHEQKSSQWEGKQQNAHNSEDYSTFTMRSWSHDISEAGFEIYRGELSCEFNGDLI